MGLKILFVASEVSPFSKSGGLGDVAGSLPKALSEEGMEVCVVCPKYENIKKEYLKNAEYVGSFNVKMDWREQSAAVCSVVKDNIKYYFIENSYYFGRDAYYGYMDDDERFAFFSKAVLDLLNIIDFVPNIIHCNDWQAAPVCLYLKDYYKRFNALKDTKSIFTIHNLQYMGDFDHSALKLLGLNEGYFVQDKLEFNNRVCYMKAGIFFADVVTTVSRTYACEIQTPEYGYGLDGALRVRQNDLIGIVNGIDYEANNPETSKKIYANFSAKDMSGKKENKRRLQKELGLPQRDDVPVLSIISRLAEQKGIDLLIQSMSELMSKDIQLVILGTGEAKYEHIFKDFANMYKDKISANIMFDDTLAQRIYAGSDIFLMPSLFEPCGLGQLFAMSYGTVPVVRCTGGLVDTITEYNFETGEGNGFIFRDYISSGFIWGVNMALRAYYDKDNWNKVVKNAIKSRFSWAYSAKEYKKLYIELTGKSN